VVSLMLGGVAINSNTGAAQMKMRRTGQVGDTR
jgi:hypothetical protein